MFSHGARVLGTHQCIGQRATDLASELQDLGGVRVIAATTIAGEAPISTEPFAVQSKRKEPNDANSRRRETLSLTDQHEGTAFI
jgi:hypothetical protein